MATGKIVRWNSEGGFGWVRIGDKDWFVHYTAITPQPKRGSNPTGTELVEVVTGQGKKGPAVLSALTREEFDRREERRVAEAAEKIRYEEGRRQYEADKARLDAAWPELEPLVVKSVSQVLTAPVELPHGAVLTLSEENVKEVALDSESGATVSIQQSFKLEMGRASRWPVYGATYTVAKGWDGVELSWGHQLVRESGQLKVRFSCEGKNPTAGYPATPRAPRLEGNRKVVQEIVAKTPIGEAVVELRLYENPDSHVPAGQFDEVFGDFEIADLVSQVDTAAFKAAGIDRMPKVEFKIANFRTTYTPASHGRDPDDGYWSTGPHETWEGGVALTVNGPFLARLTLDPHATGVILTIAGLDRGVIEKELRREIALAVKKWNLTAGAGEDYGEKLLRHLIGQIPEFKTMESLFAVDAKGLKSGQMDGVPYGQTVIAGDGKVSDSLTEKSRAVKVVAQPTAEKLGLPGKVLPGTITVYWPEGQVDTSVKEETVVEFGDPPYSGGTQVVATIKQEMVHHGEGWGRMAYDSKEIKVTIPNTPGKKYRLTEYWEGGEKKIRKDFVADVRAEYVMPRYPTTKLEKLPEGFPELTDGQYVVEFVEPRKRPWYVKVIREDVVASEPTSDVSIYLGKSSSRDPSHVWVITADGKILTEKLGDGTAVLTAIPKSALILRYQWSNYGYQETEEWEVFYRPPELTEAQKATAEEISWTGDVAKYFAMDTGWDSEWRLGVVRYSTPYYKKFESRMAEMHASYPVDVRQYKQTNVEPDPERFEPDHPILKWIEVGPEKI